MTLNGIAVNVVLMMREILLIANSMIGEASLPDFLIASDDRPKLMRVCAFNQLDRALDRQVSRRSQQQMNVFGHHDESVQCESSFAPISVKRLQKKPHVIFDNEQFRSVESRESNEVSSRRGEESSRLQERTSAAGSRVSLQTLNWHEWNSCPSRLFFFREFSFWETYN